MIYYILEHIFAPVAELADAHGSGPCAGNGLGVQISSGAPPKAQLRK